MRALLVVDVQNEFSAGGRREIAHYARALAQILRHVQDARRERRPIAWVQHHNQPHEPRAFVPGSWGAELPPGLGPVADAGPVLGRLSADEVRRSALLHLVHMGATVVPRAPRTTFPA